MLRAVQMFGFYRQDEGLEGFHQATFLRQLWESQLNTVRIPAMLGASAAIFIAPKILDASIIIYSLQQSQHNPVYNQISKHALLNTRALLFSAVTNATVVHIVGYWCLKLLFGSLMHNKTRDIMDIREDLTSDDRERHNNPLGYKKELRKGGNRILTQSYGHNQKCWYYSFNVIAPLVILTIGLPTATYILDALRFVEQEADQVSLGVSTNEYNAVLASIPLVLFGAFLTAKYITGNAWANREQAKIIKAHEEADDINNPDDGGRQALLGGLQSDDEPHDCPDDFPNVMSDLPAFKGSAAKLSSRRSADIENPSSEVKESKGAIDLTLEQTDLKNTDLSRVAAPNLSREYTRKALQSAFLPREQESKLGATSSFKTVGMFDNPAVIVHGQDPAATATPPPLLSTLRIG